MSLWGLQVTHMLYARIKKSPNKISKISHISENMLHIYPQRYRWNVAGISVVIHGTRFGLTRDNEKNTR